MPKKPFCVECGREDVPLYDNLCEACFRKNTRVASLPENLSVSVCSVCGAVQNKNRWIECDETGLKNAMKNSVLSALSAHEDAENLDAEMDAKEEDARNFLFTVRVRADVQGCACDAVMTTRVILKKTMCDTCSKISGGYYEAILQVRQKKGALTVDAIGTLRNAVQSSLERHKKAHAQDRLAFITKEERMHGGVDFYLGSVPLARATAKAIAKDYATTFSESEKLVGMKDGKNQYRVTFAVNVPNYVIGTFFALKDDVFRITDMQKRLITGQNLETKQKALFTPDEMDKVTFLNEKDVISDAVIVYDAGDEIQLLDQETLKTYTLKKPQEKHHGFGAANTIKILRWREKIFVV